eukprot:m51a1_g10617 hypothetical protein (289) ;mRNA; f:51313-52707
MDSAGPTTIYCLKCRAQKAPKEGTLRIEEVSFPSKKSKTPMKRSRWVAECSECSRPMRSTNPIKGLFDSLFGGLQSIANIPSKVSGWGDILVWGTVIVGGGVLLMIAYSFMSGRQSIEGSLRAGGDIARTEAETGVYGAKEDLTRASVILICRAVGLNKYRERWKSILWKLNPDVDYDEPLPEFVEWAKSSFALLVRSFKFHKASMPKSVSRKGKGLHERHNFISYNYVTRKQLEMWDDWRFHHEFPLPRSHAKLHALDDVMEKMCAELDLPFTRSAVIKRPKIRCCS